MKRLRCYVDGSYSPKSNDETLAGWGVLFEDGTKLSGTVPHEGTRQIAGECQAVMQAISWAMNIRATKLVIFYDYQGLPEWANNSWKAKNKISKAYQDFCMEVQAMEYGLSIELKFIKIDPAQNKADALATAAIGIQSVH